MPTESLQTLKNFLAPNFDLLSVDGRRYTLEEVSGRRGLVVTFICNHCPYVQAIAHKIADAAKRLKDIDINLVAINSNDFTAYPEDSYEKMQEFAELHEFNFPYLLDETQEVALSYGAVCTPDFFGFNRNLKLQYHGRLDRSRKEKITKTFLTPDLLVAMIDIALSDEYSGPEHKSIGCSIKWRPEMEERAKKLYL